jgi:hypothetical protein
MDARTLSTVYTNFCHVTFTPEELILDFGLNTQTSPSATQPIKLTHRVVRNFYTAKRVMNGLAFAVNRYESLFGSMELDFQNACAPAVPADRRPSELSAPPPSPAGKETAHIAPTTR